MQAAVHQTLINDIENLLSSPTGIDETQAKQYRKQAETLINDQLDHPLTKDLEDGLSQLRDRIHTQVEKRDADFEKVIAELGRATQALKEENLKIVEDATHKALSIAGQIPGLSEQRRADIDKKLDQIYPKMRKLSAWRHWGTTRAREDLIEQIKQIVGSGMDPNKIVTRLREAKKQWQDWEQSGDHSEHKLWKEFSNTCDLAYEPCREFFKAQKQERKNNLAAKRQLIVEINQRFEDTDWAQPDWKEIDKWLRQVRGKFFKIGHTDYKQHKKLKTNLDKALEQFEEHLTREREHSLKVRRKLIEDVLALEQIPDLRDAMSTLDDLKKKWVITVLGKRSLENKLWTQYQQAQDLIYAKRNAERKEQDHERNDNLKQKRLQVEKLLEAANAPPEAMLSDASVVAQTIDTFNNIGYVPRKAEKALMDNWRKAQKHYKTALATARKAQARSSQNALLEKARLCAGLEQKQQQGEPADPVAATLAYEALPALSRDIEPALRARLTQASTDKPLAAAQLKINTKDQLARCMKLEVMLDLPTPEAYTRERMAFQIERLSASMKKNSQAQENVSDLKTQLLICGAIEPKQFDPVWARIDAILDAV